MPLSFRMWVPINYGLPGCISRKSLITRLFLMALHRWELPFPARLQPNWQKPDKPVIAVTGDGGFLMNGVELATAKRLGLAFVIVIFHDSKYGLIEWKQLNKFDRTNAIEFTDPDF